MATKYFQSNKKKQKWCNASDKTSIFFNFEKIKHLNRNG